MAALWFDTVEITFHPVAAPLSRWKAVMAALVKVGYHGTLSPEIGYKSSDPDQINKVSQALDKILAMA